MLARYTTSYADFKHAQRLNIYCKTLGRARYVFFVWILPVLGALAAGTLVWDIAVRHFALPSWAGGVLAALAWAGLATAAMRPFIFRRGYKLMKNGRGDDEPIELELSGTELVSRVPGRSEGRFFRSAVHTFAEDDRVLLIYVSKRMFLMIPKRTVPAPDVAEVRTWLTTPSAAPQPPVASQAPASPASPPAPSA